MRNVNTAHGVRPVETRRRKSVVTGDSRLLVYQLRIAGVSGLRSQRTPDGDASPRVVRWRSSAARGDLAVHVIDRRPAGRAAYHRVSCWAIHDGIALLRSREVGSHAWLLGFFRLCQGIALGGAWDGLPALLSLNSPPEKRGWYAMIPQLGAPLGLFMASVLFAYFLSILTPTDFLQWGWRYPFFVALAINVSLLRAAPGWSQPGIRAPVESGRLQLRRIRDPVREGGR